MNKNSFHIAGIYAKAIVKLNLGLEKFKQIAEEITEISNYRIEVLKLPQIEKLSLSKETIKIISLLYGQKKLFILKDLSTHLQNMLLKMKNSMLFVISSKSPLLKEETEVLKKTLNNIFKKEILLEEKSDASLIGGFTLSFGSYLLDFSKKSKIFKIKACILNS